MNIVKFDPMEEGFGSVYHSGWIDEPAKFLATVPKPFGIISLAIDSFFPQSNASDLVEGSTFLLRHFIDDSENGILDDDVLMSIVAYAVVQLSRGVNVLIHCIAGRSRSTYIHCAIRMMVTGESSEEAFAHIVERKPDARFTVDHFPEHLKRFEEMLAALPESENA